MNCPKCSTDSYIVDSRMKPDNSRYRRYQCPYCGERFTTTERLAGTGAEILAAKFVKSEKELRAANQKLNDIRSILGERKELNSDGLS